MSVSTLAQGRILGEIQTRPTKTGGQITFFKMQVINGTTKELWSISTFSDTVREELSGISAGDSVSVVGTLHAEIFEWKGEQRIGLRLTVDRALALKRTPKAKKPSCASSSEPRSAREMAAASWAARAAMGGDDPDV